MHSIHPTAIVSPETILGEDVEIGPYSIIQGTVTLGNGVKLLAHAHISGPVTIGAETMLYPGACIGFPGQDFKFKPGMPTAGVTVGEKCIFREHSTVHAATKTDKPTIIGNGVMLMANAHVGHDGRVGDNAILVNGCMTGGHVEIGDRAILSGSVAIHQFCRVGRLAMCSGGAVASTEVPPYCLLLGRDRLAGVNLVGMRRAGISREDIKLTRHAFRQVLHTPMLIPEMLDTLDRISTTGPVKDIRDFIATAKRPIAPGYGRPSREIVAYIRNLRKGRVVTVEQDGEAE